MVRWENPTGNANLVEQPAPHRYSRSPRPSRTTQVTNELGRAIVSGHYPQNAILPGDAELLAQFGVSRTVLREAVKILAGKGLLQSRARIGTRVRRRTDWNLFDADVLIWHAEIGFDAAFIAHLGEMRMALEPEAAALAAERRSVDQLAELYDWVEKMGAKNVSAAEFVAADLNFHLAVATAAANPFLKSISTLIEVALVAALSRSSPVDDDAGLAHSVGRHRAIAEAIDQRDPAAARAAMREVIGEGMARSAGRYPGAFPAKVDTTFAPRTRSGDRKRDKTKT
jgi:DNA-binding FadR family transcriptional regulator